MAPPFVKLVWPPEIDALLGAQSDLSIAKLLDVHPQTVKARRRALGIPTWYGPPPWQPKRSHQRICVFCGEQFTIVGGRASRLRTTCPPPRGCQGSLRQKTLAMAGPKAHLKRVSGLLGMHFLTDDDNEPDLFTRLLRPTPAKRRRPPLTVEFVKQASADD